MKESSPNEAVFFKNSLWASVLGAVLLALVYIGFGSIGAIHSAPGIASEELLGAIAFSTLGSYAGLVVSSAVALACLTTAVALASAFTDFVQTEILKEKISYPTTLFLSLGLSFGMSTLGFAGIGSWLSPILEWIYPALICLTLFSLWQSLRARKGATTVQGVLEEAAFSQVR